MVNNAYGDHESEGNSTIRLAYLHSTYDAVWWYRPLDWIIAIWNARIFSNELMIGLSVGGDFEGKEVGGGHQ